MYKQAVVYSVAVPYHFFNLFGCKLGVITLIDSWRICWRIQVKPKPSIRLAVVSEFAALTTTEIYDIKWTGEKRLELAEHQVMDTTNTFLL